ncbi:hypothetical protein K1719_031262 [Acacia pycnantha]|nr:hypothetical protein K1719_031262 [Acacia pycnantha]
MAAKNKYVSTNFNHIYEKTTTPGSNTNPAKIPSPASSSSSSYSAASYSAISSPNKPHGRMLVLTRPNPKPVVAPPLPSSPIQSQQRQHQQLKQTVQHASDQPQSQPGSDANEISLRPLGHTGTGSSLSSPVLNCEKNVDIPSPLISPKSGKFVPPHLRPGFVPKEEKIGPDVARSRQQGNVGSPGRKSTWFEWMKDYETEFFPRMKIHLSVSKTDGFSGNSLLVSFVSLELTSL